MFQALMVVISIIIATLQKNNNYNNIITIIATSNTIKTSSFYGKPTLYKLLYEWLYRDGCVCVCVYKISFNSNNPVSLDIIIPINRWETKNWIGWAVCSMSHTSEWLSRHCVTVREERQRPDHKGTCTLCWSDYKSQSLWQILIKVGYVF